MADPLPGRRKRANAARDGLTPHNHVHTDKVRRLSPVGHEGDEFELVDGCGNPDSRWSLGRGVNSSETSPGGKSSNLDSDFCNIEPEMTTAPPSLDHDPLDIRGFDADMVVNGLKEKGEGALGPIWESERGDGTADVCVFGVSPREGFDAATLRIQLMDRLRELAVITHPCLGFPLGVTIVDGVVGLVYRGRWDSDVSPFLNGNDFLRRLGNASYCLRATGRAYCVFSNSSFEVCCWGLIGSVDALAVDPSDCCVASEMFGDDGRPTPTDATDMFTLAAICAMAWYNITDPSRWGQRVNDVHIRPLLEACLSPNPDDRPDIATATLGIMAEESHAQEGWAAPHVACERNEMGHLQTYLDSGGDVEARTLGLPDHNHTTPMTLLEVGCKYGSLACIDLLLDRGADLKVGRPLCLAARGGHIEVIGRLIHAGAIVVAPDFDGVGIAAGFAVLLDHFEGDLQAVAKAYVAGRPCAADCIALLIRRGVHVGFTPDVRSWRNAKIREAHALVAAVGVHALDDAEPVSIPMAQTASETVVSLSDDRRSVRVPFCPSSSVASGDSNSKGITITLPSWIFVFESNDFAGGELLGRGTYGVVTKRKLLGRTEAAVKELAVPTTHLGLQSFVWEVASHVMLSAHPNTVSLMGLVYDETNGTLGLVCELMDMDLVAWLGAGREVCQRARVLRTAATGLSFLHSKGLVHRDIKPANIFVNASGDMVKIGDFGLTSVVGGREGWTRTYAAPEVLLRDDVSTAASDGYSFGLVVYEVLSGVEEMPTAKERQGKEEALPWEINDDLPVPGEGWWASLLMTSLCPDAAARPPVCDWKPALELVEATRTTDYSKFFGACVTNRWDVAEACAGDTDLEGANVDTRMKTALHHVANSAHAPLGMIAKCVGFGRGDVNAQSAFSTFCGSPIAFAATAEIARELVVHGAEVDICNDRMITPLMCAARKERVDVVRFLVSQGANLAAVDSEGRSVVDWAYRSVRNPDEKLVLELLSAGAVVGKAAEVLGNAHRNGHHRVVERLTDLLAASLE